jgi:hypothetical protein
MGVKFAVLAVAGVLSFVQGRLQPDGGYSESGGRSTVALMATGVLALHAAGAEVSDQTRASLLAHEDGLPPTELELVVMAEAVTGGASDDALASLHSLQHETGAIGEALNSTYWGVLALRQAGESVTPATISFILRGQQRNGGFPWIRGVPADTDDTSAAVQSLVAAGAGGKPVARALTYLRARQNADGGFELKPGGPSNASRARGRFRPSSLPGEPPASAFRYLRRLQAADGRIRYSVRYATTPLWVSAQVLLRCCENRFRCDEAGRRDPRGTPPRARGGILTPVLSRGYSRSEHWTSSSRNVRAFLKLARIDPSRAWLRDEVAVYGCVDGPFMPRLLGFEDGPEPLLVLEDLTPGARFPPPWAPGDVDTVLATLSEVAACRAELPRLDEHAISGWSDIASDPEPLLSLGLVTRDWLAAALPSLLDAAAAAPLGGDSVVHCDVRSDNLCLRDGRAVLFDWNHASCGNSAFDVAFWLPSLALEGGPDPRGGNERADQAHRLLLRAQRGQAGLPPPEGAPRVRGFQLAQLEVALPWACAVLGLRLHGAVA